MSATDPRSLMLADLTRCAYRLGLAFGAEAEAAGEMARKIEYFELFDRCFFAVRVATALQLRLARPQPAEARTDREDLSERPERDPAERDDDIAEERDRDRDRETERASLPVLLKTLHGVAADAAALPGPEPAALPSLRELLAQVTGAPAAPAVTPAARPQSGGLRARLTGSAGVATLAPPGQGPGGLQARRATGPPRR